MRMIIDNNIKKANDSGNENNGEVINFDSLKETINTADDDDVIFLEGLTYYCTEEITINKQLTIYGGANATDTKMATLDAQGKSRIFNIASSDVTLIGIKFINGNTTDNGGAIYWNDKSGHVENCTFTNNTSENGGAINWIDDNGNVKNCIFTNNSANQGGAILWR